MENNNTIKVDTTEKTDKMCKMCKSSDCTCKRFGKVLLVGLLGLILGMLITSAHYHSKGGRLDDRREYRSERRDDGIRTPNGGTMMGNQLPPQGQVQNGGAVENTAPNTTQPVQPLQGTNQ